MMFVLNLKCLFYSCQIAMSDVHSVELQFLMLTLSAGSN